MIYSNHVLIRKSEFHVIVFLHLIKFNCFFRITKVTQIIYNFVPEVITSFRPPAHDNTLFNMATENRDYYK